MKNSKQFNSSIAAFTENILNQIATKMYKANENTCKQTLLTSDNCKENHIETIKAEMTSKK